MPCFEPSRPMPLSFMPPNGAVSIVDADDAVFERLGQFADRHGTPQGQHHQEGELRRAQAVPAKFAVEGACDPARRTPRGEA